MKKYIIRAKINTNDSLKGIDLGTIDLWEEWMWYVPHFRSCEEFPTFTLLENWKFFVTNLHQSGMSDRHIEIFLKEYREIEYKAKNTDYIFQILFELIQIDYSDLMHIESTLISQVSVSGKVDGGDFSHSVTDYVSV